ITSGPIASLAGRLLLTKRVGRRVPENWKSRYLRPAARSLQSSGIPAVNQRAETVSGKSLAPRVGLEPTTLRLTAECSTIELPRTKFGGQASFYTSPTLPATVRPEYL